MARRVLIDLVCLSFGLAYLQSGTNGFDWFVATLFLMMNGDGERTWKLLHKMSVLTVSAYVWPNRLHVSVNVTESNRNACFIVI